jgi:cyanate lyase
MQECGEQKQIEVTGIERLDVKLQFSHRARAERGEAMNREKSTQLVLEARKKKGLSYQEIADRIGRHVVWTAAALMGQASMGEAEAEAVAEMLELSSEVAETLQEFPMKGSLHSSVPVDPLIYRLHEITQVYGTAIKAVIHEKFGDGIMSAIDFEIDIERVADPKGDRVKLTYNGKFLPYRKW